MRIGLSIDPSIYQHAFAVWLEDTLIWAGIVRSIHTRGDAEFRAYELAVALWGVLEAGGWTDFDWIIVEDQVIRKLSSARSTKVLHTAATVLTTFLRAKCPGAFVRMIIPEAWKGPQSKQSTETQIRRLLSSEELLSIEDRLFRLEWRERRKFMTASMLEDSFDQWDAIAIGASYLNRGLRMKF